jgi:hypothetical protein
VPLPTLGDEPPGDTTDRRAPSAADPGFAGDVYLVGEVVEDVLTKPRFLIEHRLERRGGKDVGAARGERT